MSNAKMTNKYWFTRKRYGYGATPVTWEGWLLTLGFIIIVTSRVLDAEKRPFQFTMELIVLIFVLIIVAIKKTEGGFKWQWG
jgi:hypothetical protein|tara:strand:+ start:565 stop:810 length:246 start_codon:yes stop_codon:yes gene_type:complete